MNSLLETFYYSRLNKFCSYDKNTHGINITYNFNSEKFAEVRRCYNLESYIGRCNFKDMQNIMHTVFDAFYAKDSQKNIIKYNGFTSISLFDMVQKDKNPYISCWGYAQTLTECFLSLGIPARMIRAHSGLIYDRECHCVCVAYCTELKKNVLFDVANNTIYYSDKCAPLDLNEFREYIMHKKRIIVLQKRKGEKFGLIRYWIKNLIVFQCFENEAFGNALNKVCGRVVYLIPESLNLRKTTLLKSPCKSRIITRNSDEFWQLPFIANSGSL